MSDCANNSQALCGPSCLGEFVPGSLPWFPAMKSYHLSGRRIRPIRSFGEGRSPELRVRLRVPDRDSEGGGQRISPTDQERADATETTSVAGQHAPGGQSDPQRMGRLLPLLHRGQAHPVRTGLVCGLPALAVAAAKAPAHSEEEAGRDIFPGQPGSCRQTGLGRWPCGATLHGLCPGRSVQPQMDEGF